MIGGVVGEVWLAAIETAACIVALTRNLKVVFSLKTLIELLGVIRCFDNLEV